MVLQVADAFDEGLGDAVVQLSDLGGGAGHSLRLDRDLDLCASC